MAKQSVLIIGFNRPDLTRQVMDSIRQYQPERLYVACDGPRQNVKGEHRLVRLVQRELQQVDWSCSVTALFQETNLGLRDAVVSAIDWFFTHEEEGIILEDDCVPSPDFFTFMEYILERYREDLRVWGATGSNPHNIGRKDESTFYFVRTALIWGWASWANRWRFYDRDLSIYRRSGWSGRRDKWPNAFLYHALDWHLRRLMNHNQPDSWAYQWAWTVVFHAGLWALPEENLINNVGFRADATHTKKQLKVAQDYGYLRGFRAPEAQVDWTVQGEVHQRSHRVFRPFFLNLVRDIFRSWRGAIKP